MGTRYKGEKRERQALDTLVKLLRCADSVSTALSRGLEAEGLTESQFGVLEALHHLGPLCMTELARKLLKSGGNLTLVTRNLEKRGLVSRRREGSDRRYYSISLTEKGRKTISRLFPRHVTQVVALFSVLSASEQVELSRVLRRLGMAAASRS